MISSLLHSAINEYLLDYHPSWKLDKVSTGDYIWIDNPVFTKHIAVGMKDKIIVLYDHHYHVIFQATYNDTDILGTITSIILSYDAAV